MTITARRLFTWCTVGMLPVLVVFGLAQLRELAAAVRDRFADAGTDSAFAQLPAAGEPPSGSMTIGFRDLRFAAVSTAVSGASVEGPTRYAGDAPDSVRRLDGRPVRLRGYMVPTRTDGEHVRECIVVASQLNCCYGQPPAFCEFVVARITGGELPMVLDVPLAFSGTLHVGDVYEHGNWVALYTLDCSAVER
jgi:hypothetical protein